MNFSNQKSVGYGEIYVVDSATAQSIPTGGAFTKVTLFGVNGQTKRCASDHANDKITINKNGIYLVNGSFSWISGTGGLSFTGAGHLADAFQGNLFWKMYVTSSSYIYYSGFTGLINVTAAPSDLDLRVNHTSGGSVNFTLVHGNINAILIG